MKEWIGRVGLAFAAIVLTLGVAEIGLRAAYGWPLWDNLVLNARRVLADREHSRFVEDPLLGYEPRPGFTAAGVSFDREGFRSTGEAAKPGPAILAVGDSYTYGDEVGDGETWPAHLQRLVGVRVLNAGVSGYGFDQSVLRAEKRATGNATGRPLSAIVVSFIADDIRRTEMSRQWGANKPYFDIVENLLVLRNVPVPPRPDPATTLSFWQRAFGRSYLVDFVLRRLDLLHDWFGDHIRVHDAGDGERIACLLTGRLAELQRISGARVLLMAQYDPVVWQDAKFAAEQRRLTEGVLRCGRQAGLAVLDTFEPLSKAEPKQLYGLWHMNDAGNRLIAERVAAALNGAP